MRPDYARAQAHALHRLRTELPAYLYYHALFHTADDVLPAATRLAAGEGVAGAALALLQTAACYHDIGFIEQRDGHEAIGVRIAQAALPRFGFNADEIALVCGMIMATRLPQTPHTHLEQIMADADLDVFGRDDFWPRNVALRDELAAQGQIWSDADWYRSQWAFLSAHRYFTAAAHALRDAAKQRHLAELAARWHTAGTVTAPPE
jgi:uncharacterized protein